jgi:hypothetical protein
MVKAFWLTLAAEAFNDPDFKALCQDQQRSPAFSKYKPNELVVTFDMTFPTFPGKSVGFHTWEEWRRKHRPIGGACSSMGPRVSSFVKGLRSRKDSGEGIAALELNLEWTPEYYLLLLVEFDEGDQGIWRPKRSVLRVM